MSELKKNKKGFTLIELIIAIAITVIIIGTVTSMVVYSYKAYYSADKTSAVLDASNTITEMVREYIFNAEEAEISNITAPPSIESGYTYIYCLDNCVYADGALIQSAKGIGAAIMTLDFSTDTVDDDDNKMITYTLNILDENGKQLIAENRTDAFLNKCDDGITGIESGNCLKVKKTVTP